MGEQRYPVISQIDIVIKVLQNPIAKEDII